MKRIIYILGFLIALGTTISSCQKNLSAPYATKMADYDILEGGSQVGGPFLYKVSGPQNTSNYMAIPVRVTKSGTYSIITRIPLADALTGIDPTDATTELNDTITFVGSGLLDNALSDIDTIRLYPVGITKQMPADDYHIDDWEVYHLNKYDSSDYSNRRLDTLVNFSFQIGTMDYYQMRDTKQEIALNGYTEDVQLDNNQITINSLGYDDASSTTKLAITIPFSDTISITQPITYSTAKENSTISMSYTNTTGTFSMDASNSNENQNLSITVESYDANTRVLKLSFSGSLINTQDASSTFSFDNGIATLYIEK